MLTTRACRWVVEQVGREHASIAGLARQLGTTWRTVWTSIAPVQAEAADDEARFAGVTTLGMDEHLWRHGGGMLSATAVARETGVSTAGVR